MARLGFLLEKEFKQFIRNALLPKLVIMFPILVMLIMPWVATMEVNHVEVTVVDNDRTQLSRRLIDKIAASGDYANYASLKATAMHRGVKFLFETNVGAGLPIINTINDLINSGDKIIRIEAVLSGTLNYVFNALAPDVPLSLAVRRAVEEGYAEPDPRIDLSGRDVARKLVILAREAGYRIGQEDIEQHPFIPDALMSLDLDGFNAVGVMRSHTFDADGIMIEYTESRQRPGFFSYNETAVRPVH